MGCCQTKTDDSTAQNGNEGNVPVQKSKVNQPNSINNNEKEGPSATHDNHLKLQAPQTVTVPTVSDTYTPSLNEKCATDNHTEDNEMDDSYYESELMEEIDILDADNDGSEMKKQASESDVNPIIPILMNDEWYLLCFGYLRINLKHYFNVNPNDFATILTKYVRHNDKVVKFHVNLPDSLIDNADDDDAGIYKLEQENHDDDKQYLLLFECTRHHILRHSTVLTPFKFRVEVDRLSCHYRVCGKGGYRFGIGVIGVPKFNEDGTMMAWRNKSTFIKYLNNYYNTTHTTSNTSNDDGDDIDNVKSKYLTLETIYTDFLAKYNIKLDTRYLLMAKLKGVRQRWIDYGEKEMTRLVPDVHFEANGYRQYNCYAGINNTVQRKDKLDISVSEFSFDILWNNQRFLHKSDPIFAFRTLSFRDYWYFFALQSFNCCCSNHKGFAFKISAGYDLDKNKNDDGD